MRYERSHLAVLIFSGLNIAVGLWLMLTPFVYGFHPGSQNTTVAVSFGALIITWAVVRVTVGWTAAAWSWINVAIGIILLAGPYAPQMHGRMGGGHFFIAGIAVVVLGLISALSTHLRHRLH